MAAICGIRCRLLAWVILAEGIGGQFLGASSCEQIAQLKLRGARVVSAKSMPAGSFLPPGADATKPEAGVYRKLPAFCRVVVQATPAADSQIPIEVWMPLESWNQKFRGQGNGGYAGSFDFRGMAGSLGLGYATAGTDTGHSGEATDSSWALGHPEKVKDFGYRAVHEMTDKAKTVIAKFYAIAPKQAYFDSCSDGGREALMEAQRFPRDYDGILAGAPANYWTHLLTGGLEVARTITKKRSSFIPPEKLSLITTAALAACDANEGVRDGILNDPTRCHFDPAVLLCSQKKKEPCLSKQQIQTIKKVYGGETASRGEGLTSGLMPTSEAGDGGWKDWVTGETFGGGDGIKYTTGFFKNMVYEDPNWDYRSANIAKAQRAADQKLAGI